jgi:hypothetical protein
MSVSQPRRIALLRCGTLIEYNAAKSTIGNSSSIIAGFDAFAALTLTPGAQRIKQFQGLNVHHLIHPDVLRCSFADTGVPGKKFPPARFFRSPGISARTRRS